MQRGIAVGLRRVETSPPLQQQLHHHGSIAGGSPPVEVYRTQRVDISKLVGLLASSRSRRPPTPPTDTLWGLQSTTGLADRRAHFYLQ